MSELHAALKACTACKDNGQISTLCTIFHFAQEKKSPTADLPKVRRLPRTFEKQKIEHKTESLILPSTSTLYWG